MASSDPRLKTHARKKLRASIGLLGLPCHRCGHPINYAGPWDLDELLPRYLGGDPLDVANTAAAHVHCNRAAGAAITNARRHPRHPIEATEW